MTLLAMPSIAAVAEIGLTPKQTLPDKAAEFSLSVKNLAGDNINKVELIVPQQDNVPLYQIREVGNPVGWTYETRHIVGSPSPTKIIWFTGDSGISAARSLNFNFVVASPSTGGNFTFGWKVTDLASVENSGSTIVTNFLPTVSKIDLRAPTSINAGKEFNLVVTALDQNRSKKTDYTGTVKFESTDAQAVLPSNYTFQLLDGGTKTFKIKLKSAGVQEIKVSDGTFESSTKITVLFSEVTFLDLKLSNSTVTANDTVIFAVWYSDLYGNKKDVTKNSKFEIDKEAKGILTNNTYKTEVLGNWTIVAAYAFDNKKLYDGEILTITETIPLPTPPAPPASPEPPKEEEKPPEKKLELELISDDLVNILANSTKTFSLTVKNTGEADLKNVNIVFTGFPENQMNISPESVDVARGKSKVFTATIFVPEITEPQSVTFIALSKELPLVKLNSTKTVTFNITEAKNPVIVEPATGRLVLTRNLTYLGIAIVIAIVLILLFWTLFLSEEKKSKRQAE